MSGNLIVGKKVHRIDGDKEDQTLCNIPHRVHDGWHFVPRPVTCARCIGIMFNNACAGDTLQRTELLKAVNSIPLGGFNDRELFTTPPRDFKI